VNPSYRFRPARPDDVSAVHRVHSEAIQAGAAGHYAQEIIDVWAGAFNPENFPRNIERMAFYVAESREGGIDGFLAIDLETGEVDSVYVAPWGKGRGLGSALMALAEEVARDRGVSDLWLDASLNAVPFYERHGWRAVRDHARVRQGVEIPLVRMEKTLGI
jgi:GNAT superfamily N-acetyltransferase